MLHSVYLFLNIGTGELMLIFFVALLLFGGEKLPGIARTLGRGIRDFKDASEDVKREINKQINSFDEVTERKKKTPTLIEETTDHYSTEKVEEPVIVSDAENPDHNNIVDTSAEVEAPVAEVEMPQQESEPQERKKIDFTKPANTVEYKG
ncbi:twin-arginine translocase TatA/TatE family subunit [Mucilaginibacter limnophilus]|uniref:Sec-independent protein translocase protein TatA n=1 Tax=Mucilaginibacter limnophilus TaxID=1932778 RepID=A0A437MW57_9SPHI|nr:twin-arginine translocase TatA/TatE family subunit [Mucilaginibacter limnophilus]RVU01900.1 twin-arginine translocase TatA/TatE family subunit [Mucilaginibacter limnophilus]